MALTLAVISSTLTQIVSYLHPLDLLRLSWTCKSFRTFLTTRTSVWKVAFEALPHFPPCPKDLSFPRYALIAFATICDVINFRSLSLQSD
jgi:hypothetical protein